MPNVTSDEHTRDEGSRTVHLHCHYGRRVSKRFTFASAAVALIFALTATVSSYAFVRLANGAYGLYWANGSHQAIVYTISTAMPAPGITDGSADAAIRLGFARWQAVPSTSITFQEDATPASRARTDWQSQDLHLVWFDTTDSSNMFSANSGLVAVTPVSFGGDGSIFDADIIFNARDHQFSTTLQPGTFDVQNIATHEIGHFMGLDHSAILGATMNPFAVEQDVRLRSLESDDVAGASTIYPHSGFALGSISGKIMNGGSSVSGAHVVAEDTNGSPCSSGLSQADGTFQISGLAQGSYTVYVEPLDGPVVGQNLSLATSNLVIETNFGTTFVGGETNPTPIFVGTGADTPVGTIAVRPTAGITIQGIQVQGSSVPTLMAGDTASVMAWGSGFLPGDKVFFTGDGFTISALSVTSTAINFTVQVDPAMPTTMRTLRLVRTSTSDARCLTGGIEIRLPAPVLSGLSPAAGTPGVAITLNGANLNPGGTVVVGSSITASPSASGGTVVFPCPNLPDGTYDLTYQNADGQAAALTQALTISGGTVVTQTPATTTSNAGNGTLNTGNSTTTSNASPTATSGTNTVPSGFVQSSGGGGGGGGGCEIGTGRSSPVSLLPIMAVVCLLFVRRRAA
jgi:hypothetical protein